MYHQTEPPAILVAACFATRFTVSSPTFYLRVASVMPATYRKPRFSGKMEERL